MKEVMTPISRSITPEKSKEWHRNVHHFFTKQAANVVGEHILHYTNPGDIVLDPFVGAGVTAIEALAKRRKVIVMDLSPFACFITQQTIAAPIDITRLRDAFYKLSSQAFFQGIPLKDYINDLFKKPDKEIEQTEVPYWYPKQVKCPHNSDFEYVEDMFDKRQLIAYAILWHEIGKIEDEAIKGIMKLVFSSTMARANLTYNLSTTRGENRLGDGGSAIFAQYRYWRPPRPIVLNVWERFEWRFREIARAKDVWNKIIGDFLKDPEAFRLIQGSATELTKFVKPDSIDYIYTDPPYGAHIEYLDLETMWDAWLGFKIGAREREQEIIEGGSLAKTAQDFDRLLKQAVQEMHTVLKPNAWLSIVFAHKDVGYWNSLVDAFRDAGFEYEATTVQPTNRRSIHWKKNPLRVLSNQLIVHFHKTTEHVKVIPIALPATIERIILNVAERVIVANNGATTDQIYEAVIPELIETGNLHEATRKLKTLLPLLEDSFDLDFSNRWQLKKGMALGDWVPYRQRIRYYVQSVLNKMKRATLDAIHGEVIPLLANGRTPTTQELTDVIEEIAFTRDKKTWELKPLGERPLQMTLDFRVSSNKLPEVPIGVCNHNEAIYRLTKMGHEAGFSVWIGKREQSEAFRHERFSDLSLTQLPITDIQPIQQRRIGWIDVIWFHETMPVLACEVEEHTGIRDALERFSFLLELTPDISGRLIIVAPDSRARKLVQELTSSRYIGHPLYMENKVRYLFYSSLVEEYERLQKSREPITIAILERITKSPLAIR